MTKQKIEIEQRKIAKTLQTKVHPDNPLAIAMTTKYRELETLKQTLK